MREAYAGQLQDEAIARERAAARAAPLPAELRRVPLHGEAAGAAPKAEREPELCPDFAALCEANNLLLERLRRQPRAEREIKRAQEHVFAALECVALAEIRLRDRLAR